MNHSIETSPLVSVLIPTYNHEKYIAQYISGCLEQTYRNIELCIVDDSSTDNTKAVIEETIKNTEIRVKFVSNKENLGHKSFALVERQLYDMAEGNYLAFIDGDDYMMPERIKTQIDFLEKNEEYSAVGSRCFYKTETGKNNFCLEHFCQWLGSVPQNFIYLMGMPVHKPTLMFRNCIGDLPNVSEKISVTSDVYLIYFLM